MFGSVLIANRGEIAVRIVRTCRELGIRTVVAHSDVDRDSMASGLADATVQIGPARARHSYLNAFAIIQAALQAGAEAVHPGYGFLSEDADFAEACAHHGLVFIGPPPGVLASLGDKIRAREFAAAVGVPVIPGSPACGTTDEAMRIADEIGYPVIIKAAAGGGGRGMTVVRDARMFSRSYREARATAQALFQDSRIYVEKFIETARHIEVQVLADGHGKVMHLGERDCSLQRNRQKLIEETPAPGLTDDLRSRILDAAVTCASACGYVGAGTLEFLMDHDGAFYFIEANCRIQVEHPVTELVTGIDLVREQLMIADGGHLEPAGPGAERRGVAIECRVNIEDPERGFIPTPGVLEEFVPPAGPFTRVDTYGRPGARVRQEYDSLLAKVSVWAPDRDQAIARMDRALGEFQIRGRGVHTTIDFLRDTLAHPLFRDAKHTTAFVEQMMSSWSAADNPGRPGYRGPGLRRGSGLSPAYPAARKDRNNCLQKSNMLC
jgi:acetyl-CoA carboxylase, biotin carboxylase subunit